MVALPKFGNLGEVAVALAMLNMTVSLGLITTLLAVKLKASPTPRVNVPTVILSAPPFEKSKVALKFERLEVNAVEPGNNDTFEALTLIVPLNWPVVFE